MKELAAALLAFQNDAPALQRDALNPHFHSQYLSLEALMEQVLPALNRHGLVLMHFPTTLAGAPALRSLLLHAESGEFCEDTMLLSVAKANDPQAQGSAITYARRYAAMAILGLVADADDDGNAASAPPRRPRARGPKLITQEQRDQLGAAAVARGMSAARARTLLREVAGVDRSDAVPAAKFDAVLTAIQEYEQEAA